MTIAFPLRPDLSEAAFQSVVLELAMLRGWRCFHPRPARTANGWATALTGHAGFPDLVLARRGVVIVAELKSARGRMGPGQAEWLAELGAVGRCWRPVDWPEIRQELA